MLEQWFAATPVEREVNAKRCGNATMHGALGSLGDRAAAGKCQRVHAVRKVDERSVTLVNVGEREATVITRWSWFGCRTKAQVT